MISSASQVNTNWSFSAVWPNFWQNHLKAKFNSTEEIYILHKTANIPPFWGFIFYQHTFIDFSQLKLEFSTGKNAIFS